MASSLCTSLFQSRALDSKSVCSVFNLNPGKARWPSISPPLNWMTCCCSHSPELLELHEGFRSSRRKAVMGLFTGVAISLVYCDKVGAVSTSKRALRSQKIPENEYTNLPNGLKMFESGSKLIGLHMEKVEF